MKISKLLLISLIIFPLGSSMAFAKGGDRHAPSEPVNKYPTHQNCDKG